MRIAPILLMLMLTAPATAEWVNSLKPQRKTVSVDLSLPIRIPAAATTMERKAAEDLRQWIKQMTGVEPEIKSTDDQISSIQIGTDKQLAPDGYRIEVKDKKLSLYGA